MDGLTPFCCAHWRTDGRRAPGASKPIADALGKATPTTARSATGWTTSSTWRVSGQALCRVLACQQYGFAYCAAELYGYFVSVHPITLDSPLPATPAPPPIACTAELTALCCFAPPWAFRRPEHLLSTALAANLGLRRALRLCLAVPTGWTLLMLGSRPGLGALITGRSRAALDGHADGLAYCCLAWKLPRRATGWTAAACR